MKSLHLFFGFFLGSLSFVPAFAAGLSTVAESTGFKETGRYEEVIRLCREFQREFPSKARCLDFGVTPEGRPMKALIVSGAGHLRAEQAHQAGEPVLYFQGGIHAGEIDGKDALFWWLKDALKAKRTELTRVTLVIVPVFNVDGHERFGKNNRPNQVGPKEMGWRTTAWNLNLNRDYTKAEAPEMQAVLKLLNEWDPIVHVDLHVTDGAQFQPALSLGFVPNHLFRKMTHLPQGSRKLDDLAVQLESQMQEGLKTKVEFPLLVYPEFNRKDDPTSGISDEIAPPRFSHSYWGLRNRIGLLVETHSWKDYGTRVRVTYETVESLISIAAVKGKEWVRAAHEADLVSKHLGGTKVVLRYKPSEKSTQVDFPGYAYTVDESPVSGQRRIVYDISKKKNWSVPVFDDLQPATFVTLPSGGYMVEPAHAGWVSKKLKLHGIHFEVLHKPLANYEVETFRDESPEFSPLPFENRQMLKVSGDWRKERRNLVKGALYIPIDQPKAMLVANILEPTAEDSLLSWGYFNSYFRKVEYMEDYVTEEVALGMLKDPSVKKAFEEKLRDKAFAGDPKKRLEFFHHRHPSWDERFGLYPIYRVDHRPE